MLYHPLPPDKIVSFYFLLYLSALDTSEDESYQLAALLKPPEEEEGDVSIDMLFFYNFL